MGSTLAGLVLVAALTQTGPPECRGPYETVELLGEIAARWDEWSPEVLIAYWPDPLEGFRAGATYEILPTFLHDRQPSCDAMFRFSPAKGGRRQYLQEVRLNATADSFDVAEAAAKSLLRGLGEPFSSLPDLDESWRELIMATVRRDFSAAGPDVHVWIEMKEREGFYELNLHYQRETLLDRAPPKAPAEPFALRLEAWSEDSMGCTGEPPTPSELRESRRLRDQLAAELEAFSDWVTVVEDHADFTVVVSSSWDDERRCASADLASLGYPHGYLALYDRTPFSDLETRERAAETLASQLVGTLRSDYWQLLELR